MALPPLRRLVPIMDTRRIRPADKRADPFYTSPAWRRFIAQVIAERRPLLLASQGHLCEDPECTAQHTAQTRIFGDHIVERRDGGAEFERTNIMLRCGSSHTKKTVRERARRLGLTS